MSRVCGSVFLAVLLTGALRSEAYSQANALSRADAIVIAKTNMAEWAFSPRQTANSSYDTTVNAYEQGTHHRVPPEGFPGL
jgi:Asp-tRNA(Asn)/Glu-tRNA(Gln) amidotransferase A subunit family amidase